MKKCTICGSEKRVFVNKELDTPLCFTHAQQFRRSGAFHERDRYAPNRFSVMEEYVEIYIEQYIDGKLLGTVFVDHADFQLVKAYKWDINNGYARNKELGFMHKFITSTSANQLVDHIDENKLNNRRNNLRHADKSLNAYNQSTPRKDNKVGFRGVSSHRGKFRATIRVNGKQLFLGVYNTPEEASYAYESKRKEVLPDV